MHVSFIHMVNCISYCLMLWNVALANDSKDRFFVRRKIHFFFSFLVGIRNKNKWAVCLVPVFKNSFLF